MSRKVEISTVCKSIETFLLEKNRRYGDSALQPLGIFTSHVRENNSEALNGILVRLDDKLKRIKNSEELRENDVVDTIGYLILLCVENNWADFNKFLD